MGVGSEVVVVVEDEEEVEVVEVVVGMEGLELL